MNYDVQLHIGESRVTSFRFRIAVLAHGVRNDGE